MATSIDDLTVALHHTATAPPTAGPLVTARRPVAVPPTVPVSR